ncbi:MAG: hypothetical protein RLZZ117_435 [Cyanobacteriota bacterium]
MDSDMATEEKKTLYRSREMWPPLGVKSSSVFRADLLTPLNWIVWHLVSTIHSTQSIVLPVLDVAKVGINRA